MRLCNRRPLFNYRHVWGFHLMHTEDMKDLLHVEAAPRFKSVCGRCLYCSTAVCRSNHSPPGRTNKTSNQFVTVRCEPAISNKHQQDPSTDEVRREMQPACREPESHLCVSQKMIQTNVFSSQIKNIYTYCTYTKINN